MKIRGIVFSVLIAAAIVDFPVRAYPADVMSDEVARIASLSAQSQKAGRRCAEILGVLRRATRDSQKKEYYVSRESALSVLTQAWAYPGTPLATSEALERFFEMDVIPNGAQASELRTSIFALSDCHAAEFYGFLTRLIHPRTQQLLTSEERSRARDLVIAYVRREAAGEPKPFLQTRFITFLLSQSVNNGLVAVSPEGSAELATLKWRIQEFERESAQDAGKWERQSSMITSDLAAEKTDHGILESVSEQLEVTEGIRDDLQDLIDSESEKGNLLPGRHHFFEFAGAPRYARRSLTSLSLSPRFGMDE